MTSRLYEAKFIEAIFADDEFSTEGITETDVVKIVGKLFFNIRAISKSYTEEKICKGLTRIIDQTEGNYILRTPQSSQAYRVNQIV